MEKLTLASDFTGEGLIPYIYAISQATNGTFFQIMLIFLFLVITGASYYAIYSTTGNRLFWECITASGFVCFILSILLFMLNTVNITVISIYWIIFYILIIVAGFWFMNK